MHKFDVNCYCASCNPSFRASKRKLARDVSSGSGAGYFWAFLIGTGILFWPSIFIHTQQNRLIAETIWYGGIGLSALIFGIICAAKALSRWRWHRQVTGKTY